MMSAHAAASVMRLATAAVALLVVSTVHAVEAQTMTAAEAVRQAVEQRLGEGVDVVIESLDVPARAGQAFTGARPDPAARLGRPVRFTLTPVNGSPVIAVATLQVTGEHVVTRRALDRHQTVAAEDVAVVRAELQGVPLRRLPTADQVIGSRVLRSLAAESVIVPGAVAVRRAVEPGDKVTVVAIAGDIQVSAMLTATDGGDPGDTIRVVNRDTRRSLRGRVVKEGLVEVRHGR